MLGIFNSKKEKTIAVFDINSASIGGAIIKHYPEKNPEVLAVERTNINFLLDVDFKAFLRCTLSSFKKTSEKLFKEFSGKVDGVLCVFSSPWHISQTRIIKITREQPFEITKDFFDKITEKEKNIFKNDWSRKEESEFIEQEVMKVKLNGYPVRNPLNKKTKSLEAYIHMGLVFKDIKKDIEKYIYENLRVDKIAFHTFPFVVFNILKYIVNVEDGLLFIDISGEFTDISLIRNNILEETISFPRGKNFLMREIAASFKTFLKEAPSILESYVKNHANKNVNEKMSVIVENARSEWKRFFQDCLGKISESSLLPQNIFLVGDNFVAMEFIKCVQDNNSYSQFVVLGQPFKVNYFSTDAIKHYFNFTKNTTNTKDKFILIEALFADKFYA